MRNMVVVGSGPAGLTAALYAARANLNPLMIEGREPGGQLTLTTLVENFPGFPDGIMGPQLMDDMRKQAQRFGSEIVTGFVHKVNLLERPFRVYYGDEEVTAKCVVISTGSSAKLIGLDSERELMGHGVSTCATCDGFFYRGKKIAVVGGGDSAMEEGTFLTKFASEVNLIHRRDKLRASKIMQDRAFANPKMKFHWDTEVKEVIGTREAGVSGLRLHNAKTGETAIMEIAGLFVAIGHHPNTEMLRGQIELDELGYVKTQPGSTRTSIDGVFACGDVQDPVFRQAITAAGSGCMAAMEAEKWLSH
jgi:thioredoxin reductase (NADPH)